MKSTLRLSLVLALAAAVFLALLGFIVGLLLADLSPAERDALSHLLAPHASLLVALVGLALAAVAGLARLLHIEWAGGAEQLATQAELLRECAGDIPLPEAGPHPLRRIAASLNALTAQRAALQADLATRIAAARQSMEEERNRLAALMAELSQSIVVCNLDGRILLYNQQAFEQFRSRSETDVTDGGLIGLGRSIYGIFERGLLTHAQERLVLALARGDAHPVANCVTTHAGRLLRLQMAPVRATTDASAPMNGFILILSDITERFDQESRRDQMIHTLTEGNRASLANVRAAVEMLDFPDLSDALRERFRHVVRDEVAAMSERLDDAAKQFSGALTARWPLEEMLAQDLIVAAQRRIERVLGLPTKQEEVDTELWVEVDSFSMLQAVAYLSSRLIEDLQVREVRFRARSSGRLAHLDLIWSGAPVSTETVMNWELEPMHVGEERSPLTVRDVVDRHGGEIWLEREKVRHRAFLRLALPLATAHPAPLPRPLSAPAGRPEYYDFDLFSWSEATQALQERPLAELVYTVFDTETTGLEPSAGDEIIQIGATRIVNGRLLQHETFEQLIDPRRSLPEASVRIHGITDNMLAGQPTIERVLPAFHAFCADTVLVAHNAAFDMRFLQLKEASCAVRFDQPVLDTLLLSAIIHPDQSSHRLEAIAARFGVSISGRHTALGDALVTAEIFLHMLPLLAERGITTLGQARAAAEQSYYARIRY